MKLIFHTLESMDAEVRSQATSKSSGSKRQKLSQKTTPGVARAPVPPLVPTVALKSCHGCTQGAHVLIKYNGVAFCEECFAGCIRARHRKLRGPEDSTLIEEDRALMLDDPPAWRLKCKGFCSGDDNQERNLARTKLGKEAKAFHETRTVETETAREGNLIMNRKHFLKHYAKWEIDDDDMPKEEKNRLGNQEFGRLLEEQGDAHRKPGTKEQRVSFPDPKGRSFTDNKVERVDGVRQGAEISDEQFHARKQMMQNKAGFGSIDLAPVPKKPKVESDATRAHSSVDGGNTLSRSTLVAQSLATSTQLYREEGDEEIDSKDSKVADPQRLPHPPFTRYVCATSVSILPSLWI
jgi:hypothetical protein